MKLEHLAPAKLNLGLHVLRRRPDGYHDIETALVRIPWHDRLTASLSQTWRFTVSDPNLPTDQRNLCVQAANLLRDTYHVDRGAHLHLEKRIPYGAGLGGGSSDAASTLLLLNELWDLGKTPQELAPLAANLGADVPFFLAPQAMLASGIGTELTPLQLNLRLWAVVCVPEIAVSTAEAYAALSPDDRNRVDLKTLLQRADLAEWKQKLQNDFQQPVSEEYPEIQHLLNEIEAQSAAYAALSGSGSAVFGLFRQEKAATEAASELIAKGRRVWHGPLQWEAAANPSG